MTDSEASSTDRPSARADENDPSKRTCWCGSPAGYRQDKGFIDCLVDRSHDWRGHRDAEKASHKMDLLALVMMHRPNYVTEGQWSSTPGLSTQYTRVKCDDDRCAFYAQDPSWFVAMDLHSAHLANVLEDAIFPPEPTRPGGA